ncbi:hypothetical protein TrST_g639 [Triparma strigata]|uniref:Homeobox domain-containing protein n=1 Tax=Triparma strigata TaxID=1606541 RepID=A0A9W7EGW4_9STRA|nr:hypothetical protein TrST_g639 [Triparma strigata]
MNTGKSTSLPSQTVEYLKNWILSPDHIQHPYPTEQEKKKIMEDTGIELKQLTNWFTNNRKRFWKPRVLNLSTSLRKVSGSFSDSELPPSDPYPKRAPTSSHTDSLDSSGLITRSEVVSIYVLSPPAGGPPTIKDVTILMPKNKERVLREEKGRRIEYFFHKTVQGDRKKVQSRRDAEVVRVKKSLLRSYLNSIGERRPSPKKSPSPSTSSKPTLRVRSISNPFIDTSPPPAPVKTVPYLDYPFNWNTGKPPSMTGSTGSSEEGSVESVESSPVAKRRKLSYHPPPAIISPSDPVVITPRAEYLNPNLTWSHACKKAVEERELPSLEEAAILFGFKKGR